MSLHAAMSPLAATHRGDRDLGVTTRMPTPEERAKIIRDQIERNRNFATPAEIERWEKVLADIEKEIEEKKNQ